ncbi:MAG: DUF1330 domain-containing protein [Spirochaetes bacterium]|nr:DUF1330 domain-containing protein [Spirochaetota bacterium]
MEAAKLWYESPEYQEVVQHRFRAAETNLIIIEGKL